MFLALVAAAHLSIPFTASPDWPLTRAERTGYAETSHYSDVIDFIHGLQKAGAPVKLEYIGKTTDGNQMPLVVASRPEVTDANQARRLGKSVIYIQANIHAGEVEGKEAILHLLRRYCQEKSGVLDKAVLVINPIYNIDGNEKFGPQGRNRPGQNGPELVGTRANGQGLDLNRDYIKAETPEFQAALAHVFTKWDPEVSMDLHTTDGTRHGYALTYAPPLNPNTEDGVELYARDVMMPAIRKELRAKFSMETFDYGNAEKRGDTTAWYEVGPEARYSTNYAGLRNRIGILSEALVYLTFKDRVVATERFTEAVILWTVTHAKEIISRTTGADKKVVGWGLDPSTAPQIGVRFDWLSRGVEGVLLEKKSAPKTGVPKDLELVKMDVYDRFKATRTASLPAAYIVKPEATKVVELLLKHGVMVERLKEEWSGEISEFQITKANRDQQPFQGHNLQSLEGTYKSKEVTLPPGTYIVRTSQPLGILAFTILEPESQDGVVAWGVLGDKLAVGQDLPVSKAMKPLVIVTEKIREP